MIRLGKKYHYPKNLPQSTSMVQEARANLSLISGTMKKASDSSPIIYGSIPCFSFTAKLNNGQRQQIYMAKGLWHGRTTTCNKWPKLLHFLGMIFPFGKDRWPEICSHLQARNSPHVCRRSHAPLMRSWTSKGTGASKGVLRSKTNPGKGWWMTVMGVQNIQM